MSNSPVVRAKMVCNNVSPQEHRAGMSTVCLGAVWSPDTGNPADENALFGSLTPMATFTSIMTDKAADRFEVGKSYYVDFTPAD